jgi:hypothetical protein
MSKIISCFFCKAEVPRADAGSRAVLCSRCVARLSDAPAGHVSVTAAVDVDTATVAPRGRGRPRKTSTPTTPTTTNTGFGRGWHLKKNFTAPDGTQYSFGKKI